MYFITINACKQLNLRKKERKNRRKKELKISKNNFLFPLMIVYRSKDLQTEILKVFELITV
jgi:hypothetical protein